VEELPMVYADPTQMRQLLQNLIGNGLKFHQPDVPPTVEVEAHDGSVDGFVKQVQITVRDNGIGFEERYLDRIFQPFQRLHGRGEYEGSGIGLAICRKIVERHGGSITAESRPGQGSTFVVSLPLKQNDGGRTRD
jgi:signal transduction histidine kinase